MKARTNYADKVAHMSDGTYEAFNDLMSGKGDMKRATVMTRILTTHIAMGNLAVKLNAIGKQSGKKLLEAADIIK